MEKEIRVYAINWDFIDRNIHDFSNEEFIQEAEHQGLVWTLENFEDAFNEEYISTATHSIRIIKET